MDNLILATQQSGILQPFAWVLGMIMDVIYKVLDAIYNLFGLETRQYIIGLSIILLTIVVRMILLPMTIKQQKFSRLNAVMTPEIQAVQKKYKDKKDQTSQMAQQEEIKAVYDKYGTSPTGSCLQLIIQMPILFALYRVFMNIPAYVQPVKNLYTEVLQGLNAAQLNTFFKVSDIKGNNLNKCIDLMSGYKKSNLKLTDVLNATSNQAAAKSINGMNDFFGFNLSLSPSQMHAAGMALIIALIIPILSGLFQLISIQLTTRINGTNQQMGDSAMAGSMKMMNWIMPLFSVYMCWILSSGLGIYWVAGSIIMMIQQIFINLILKKEDINDIIEKNREKAAAKAEKRKAKEGIYRDKVLEGSKMNARNTSSNSGISNTEKEEKIRKAKEAMAKKDGSLASKANMVSEYNEKNSKKK